MRVIFMGSPDFALPSLQALIEQHELLAVVTQPDRRAGRGQALTPPPVKVMAGKHNLPVLQPMSLRDQAVVAQLADYQSELIVVAAFGQILPPAVLELPLHGCLNVHASLLPRWRGAAPIQAAILHGDTQTGISIMKMDPGLDTGPILTQEAVAIGPKATAGELSDVLAEVGGRLLLQTIPAYISGQIALQAQVDDQATYAPMLRKSDGRLDFTQSAEQLERQVRAFQPWPGSFLTWGERRVLVLQAAVVESKEAIPPGQVVEIQGKPAVATTTNLLQLLQVQPSGKNPMDGPSFLRGAQGFIGATLQTL